MRKVMFKPPHFKFRIWFGSAYILTPAEATVHWFMFGRRATTPPQHINCKCVRYVR